MHLVGFTIEIYYDARPYERQIILMLAQIISVSVLEVISILFMRNFFTTVLLSVLSSFIPCCDIKFLVYKPTYAHTVDTTVQFICSYLTRIYQSVHYIAM